MGGIGRKGGKENDPAHPARPALPALLLALCFLCILSVLRAAEIPWGLDRIDQRPAALDGRFVPGADGAGVHAYVIDTGVRRTHREFEGRADWIGDFTTGTGDRPAVDNADDCDPPPSPDRGHGTHVASILAGRTFGVARTVARSCASHPPVHRDDTHRFHGRRPGRQLDHGARLEAGGRQHQPGAIRDRRSIARRSDRALDRRWLRLCVVSR